MGTLCFILLCSAMAKAETITATWDFTNADVVAAAVALSGSNEAGTVNAVEDNGILLTIEANGQTIRDNGNSIQTGNGVVFKIPVQSKKDVVTVTGYSAPYFAYSIAGTDATDAITSYTATAADVAQGYVEVVNNGQYLIAIKVEQTISETITATWDFTNADIVAAAVALSNSTEAGTVNAVEDNGVLLTIEANGQTIRDNGNSIQTAAGVVVKVPVISTSDVVMVKGYPGYSYYSIAGGDEITNTNDNPVTTYQATASDVKKGYVEIKATNNNNYFISIAVVQDPSAVVEDKTATWDFTNADIVAAAVALSNSTEAGTIKAVEDNGILLTIEANGQTIRNNGNSIQTAAGVVVKVPVQSIEDIVIIQGYPGYSYYSIAGGDEVTNTNDNPVTTYVPNAGDVKQGYVEIKATNNNNYFILIAVFQKANGSKGDDVPADVVATWDYANADVMAETMALSESTEAGTVKAIEDNGILMTVEANGASFRNNGNNIQVRKGAVFKIPVKNSGDIVTVKGYPSYSYYTIGNSAEITNTQDNPVTEYKASAVDAQAGYVAVTSTNDNNYFLSLSVLQKAPKQKVTLTDESVVATFPFNLGTEGQKADFGSAADYFITSKVTYGSNLTLAGLDTNGFGMTRFEPLTQQNESDGGTAADESNAIRFLIQPGFGFTFTPTKVSLSTTRFGTDNGLIDVSWQNPDKSTVLLAMGVKPERNNATNPVTQLAYDIEGATPGEGTCGLLINLYHLQKGKQIGFRDIVIEGVLNGTEKEVPVLATLTINGQEYTAAEIFDDAYDADFELSKSVAMVSAENPVIATALTGELGTITYEGDETKCTVTIPLTGEDASVDYVLNVVQKPDFTLYYISPEDGQTVLTTQQVEKDSPIGHFQGDAISDYTIPEGYRMRGWFQRSDGGRKYTVADIVTSDLNLYGYCTEIETASTHKKYIFDLTSPTFYAEDHEAFNPTGEGFYYHDGQHGWAFHKDNKIGLLVGPKATVSVTLCRYGNASDIVITDANGNEIGTLPGMNTEGTDGEVVAFNYEGEGGAITLNLNTEGEMYLHGVKIVNTAEVNFESQGDWYFVKAGDAGSFIDVLDVVNGKNAAKDAARAYIFLPDGTYDLRQTVKTAISGHNISIIGQSMDKTIITTKPDKSIEGLGSADMLQNSGSNLYLQDLTLKNALDYYNAGSAGRAAVLQDAGTRTIGKNVRMLSYQDTYYSSNNNQQAYWETCDIHGTVDFICGGGDIRFQNTSLSLEPRALDGKGSRTIVAPTTNTQFGYVFDGCKVVDLAEGKGSWNYGRTWQNEPITVYLNTTLDANAAATIIQTRWIEKGMNTKDPKLFGEYNTMDEAGNDITPASNKINSHGGTFETIISAEKAAEFAYDKMFTDWDPAEMSRQLEAPADAKYDNGTITWTKLRNGTIAFAIFKNGEFVGITEGESFNITVDPANDALAIRAANQMGGLGPEAHVAGTSNGINTQTIEHTVDVIYNMQGQRVSKASRGLYIVNGKKVIR